ncbi:cell envelope integrity protein TolA [Saccharophagus degradans]|uniref:TonB-like protein n=1 Tax=Saccharophagus degradans (strain 2-40 / ATCC 43961 / DSM 17024) TaxID=203122 RepID=Q21HN9_SACD2|nr:cell envelope integrity protein TolA [Saccharophagus degradans]ABD81790.1 TonB-like protein [Saccharophagus degradans 2-40]
MNILRNIAIPCGATLAIHVVVIAALFSDWQPKIEHKLVKPPRHIEAKLVELKPKAKQAKQEEKPKKVDLTKKQRMLEEQQRAEKLKREAEVKKRQELEAKKAAEAKKKKEQAAAEAKKKERQRKEEQQRQLRIQQEFEKALLEEQGQLLEDSYATQAQSYAALIRQRVERSWSRPPSARNGMRCELSIQLVPSGRVIDVQISRSSGDAAFDRAALKAVKKIEAFPELQDMPIGLFEREFRNFKMVFQPEDLRQ